MVDPSHLTRRRFLGAGAMGLAGLALAGCSLDDGSSTDNKALDRNAPFAGDLVAPPLAMPDVTLTDTDGKPYPLREKAKGKLTFLFFGYTHCPDQCPVYLNSLARARDAVSTGPGSRPNVLFVGVDTKRDTPAVLKQYLHNIDPTFIGLTGSEKDIATANDALHFAPIEIGEPDPTGNYLVGHTSQAVAFTPDGKGHRLYGFDVRSQQFARDLPRLAEGRYK
jgi:protein SCO1/2